MSISTSRLIGKPPEAYLGRTGGEFLGNPEQAATVMTTDERIMSSGVAEQVEAVPPQVVDQTDHVRGEQVDPVGVLVRWVCARSVAAQVRSDDPPPLGGQRSHYVAEVLLRPGEAVDEQQRAAADSGLGDRHLDEPVVVGTRITGWSRHPDRPDLGDVGQVRHEPDLGRVVALHVVASHSPPTSLPTTRILCASHVL